MEVPAEAAALTEMDFAFGASAFPLGAAVGSAASAEAVEEIAQTSFIQQR